MREYTILHFIFEPHFNTGFPHESWICPYYALPIVLSICYVVPPPPHKQTVPLPVKNDSSLTLYSKKSAHWFCPFLPVTPGHWPRPGSYQICQTVLRVICKRPRSKIPYGSLALQKNCFKLWHGVYCELLSRPFDKIETTRGRTDFRKLG